MKKLLFSLSILLVAVYPLLAETLPAGVQKKASVGGITEYEFPNGLRVLLYPDPANPKITVNVTYLVGSRHEGYGETGMAHLLEHMNFIQTTNGREIKKELVDHGTQWNGTTSDDRTNYYETLPASEGNLKWALGLEADRMVNVKMDKALLDVEMTVVRNEFERGENSPQRVLEERVLSTAYLWHNYGKSTIGSRQDIERVPIERLAAFYKKFYQPDNAVVTISGALDPSKALADLASTMGRLPRPTRKLEQTYTVEPPQDGERYVELRRVGANQEIIVAYHGPSAAHADTAALQVLAGIMSGGGGGFRGGRGGGGGQGRLSKALVENKKALNASMSFRPLHDPGVVMVSAGLSSEQSLDEARKIIYETLDGIVKEPPSKDEIDRVKTRLLSRLEQSMSDSQQLGLGMTNPISQGDWRLMFYEHDQVKDVTPEDVVRVAKLYFKPSNRTVGVFIPDAKPDRTIVSEAPSLDTLLKDIKSSVSVAQGEAFEPTPANIEKRMVRSKLANGMKVAVLSRKTANDTVSAVIELHFGDETSLAGKNAVAQMASSLLMRGTKTKTRQQLQDAMDKLDARITVGGGGFAGGRGGRGGGGGFGGTVSGVSASIEAKAVNFDAALKLAVEMLREPAFPDRDFDEIRQQRIAGLEAERTDPGQLAAQFLQRRLSPYPKEHPLYSGTQEEQARQWKAVTLDEVRNFHQQFYGASHGEFVVVGSIDPARIAATAGNLLGSWSTTAAYKPLRSVYAKVDGMNQKIETPDKENAQFEAGMRIQMSDDDPDYPALVLANYMFGGSIAARMPNRIRNAEGLSYGASSRITVPADGNAAMFTATVSSNPVNTPKVESSFTDELTKAVKNGFTDTELAAARKAFLDALRVSRSQDQVLLRLIASRELRGRTMKWDEQLETRIQSLTTAQVNAAFRKHVDPSLLTIVKAGDFKKVKVYGD